MELPWASRASTARTSAPSFGTPTSDRSARASEAARAAAGVLSDLPDVGVPHDGAEVGAVLGRLAAGSSAPSE